MQSAPFDTHFQPSLFEDEKFSTVEGPIQKAQRGLWEVHDRYASDPTARFHGSGTSFTDLIYEAGAGSPMENVSLPVGLINFLEQKFLPSLNVTHSRFVSVKEVAARCFMYLDYQEPYFFLVDMPVSISHDSHKYTYRLKKTGSTVSPDRIEGFQVQFGWKFPHYTFVHKLITDPRTAAVCRGQKIVRQQGDRYLTLFDILSEVSKAVFGQFEWFESTIAEWMTNFYEEIVYEHPHGDAYLSDEVATARETDFGFWAAVSLGLFTWLKSPHGLKFLIQYHPVYYELLDWDYDQDKVVVRDGSGAWCIVDGWTIYTAKDVDRLESVPPGTCCVSNQLLHCTQLVNAKAVMKPCYCGKPRDFSQEDYYVGGYDHRSPECRRWEQENPPQMVFVSYAALDNILNKRDPQTKCERVTCPNVKCSYHAGHYMRVRALTDQRTKMLTARSPG